MTTKTRQCPKCGTRSRRKFCCGIDLHIRKRWRMTPKMAEHVVIFAKVRKGLTEEQYRANLTAIGATSTRKLKRDQHHALMERLGRCPDVPHWRASKVEREQGRVPA